MKATNSDKEGELAKICLNNNTTILFADVEAVKLLGSAADSQVVKTIVNLKP